MFSRRLIYVSTINLGLKKAQSLQVLKFVKSLYSISKGENTFFKAFSLSQVPVGYKGYFNISNKSLSRNRLINNLQMIFYLLNKKLVNKKDIIYSRDLLLLFVFALLGNTTIYEYHHPNPFVNSIIFKFYNYLPNTRLITISKALKDHFMKNNCFYKKNILVLPSAVEMSNFNNLPHKNKCRKELNFNDKNYYILHTGSPYEGRGIEKFVEICKSSSDIFFIHIGGNYIELKKFKELAKQEELNNCLFLPYLDEELILKYQKASDLLFYVITNKWPTYWCCSPLKIPEYMASGTPILASKVGSITEMIDEKTSFLFDLDKSSLQKSLLRAKSNANLASKLAESAQRKVEKFFTLEIRSRKLIKYIKINF